MLPTLKKLKGHIALGLFVRPSIRTHEWTLVGYFKIPTFLTHPNSFFKFIVFKSHLRNKTHLHIK